MTTRSNVNPERRYPVVVGRSWSMPGPAADRKLASDTRAAVVEYVTVYGGLPAEVAVRAAELVVADKARPGAMTVALTAEHLAAYAAKAAGEVTG